MSGNNFGDFLKALRKQHGFRTQKQLAEASGISQTTLSRIEAGTQRPLPETLRILAKHLRPFTYGELMERAGYFEGLPSEDRSFVSDLFDESEEAELDRNIDKIIKLITINDNFKNNIQRHLESELSPLFESEGWDDIQFTPRYFRQLFKELEGNLEYKLMVYESIERALKLSSMSHIQDSSQTIGQLEQKLIRKFKSLDEKGKHTVMTVLNIEFDRCKRLEPIAAHNDDMSDEQLELMRQDLEDL